MGGALLEPNDTALIIFKCDMVEEILEFVNQDPYMENGLIKSFNIRLWSLAIGG